MGVMLSVAENAGFDSGKTHQLIFNSAGEGLVGYRDRDPPFDLYTGWYVAGQCFEARANPELGWYLDRWEINGLRQPQVGLISKFVMPNENAVVTAVFAPKPENTHIIRWFNINDRFTRPHNKIAYGAIEPEQSLYQEGDVVTLKINDWWSDQNYSGFWQINERLIDLPQRTIQVALRSDIDVSVEMVWRN